MNGQKATVTIGLDVGGTKTNGVYRVISDHIPIVEKISATGLNLKIAGADAVCDLMGSIVDSVGETHSLTGRDVRIVVCAGIAGAGGKEDRSELMRLFRKKNPEVDLTVYADTYIALEGAFSGGSGMICITGTGSNVCVRDLDGNTLTSGGWGRRIGDPASGYQIGLRSLRVLSERLDESSQQKVSPDAEDHMLKSLVDDFGLMTRDDLISFVYDSGSSPSVLARSVIAASASGDLSAKVILVSEIRSFVNQIVRLTNKLADVNERFVHLGGLASNEHFSELFTLEMRKQLPDWAEAGPGESPAEGAHRLANSVASAV